MKSLLEMQTRLTEINKEIKSLLGMGLGIWDEGYQKLHKERKQLEADIEAWGKEQAVYRIM